MDGLTPPRFDVGDAVRVRLPAFPCDVDLLPGLDVRAMYDSQVGWVVDPNPGGDDHELLRVAFEDEHLAPGLWPTRDLVRVCETCRAELREDDGTSWPYCPRCRYVVRSNSARALYGGLPWDVVELPAGRVVRSFQYWEVADRVALYLNGHLIPVEA